MNRKVRYGGIGIGLVVVLLVAYYAIPVGLVIVSLGEICPYSPSGIDLCSRSARAPVCFTLTRDRSKWVEIGFRFVRASRCPTTTGTTTGQTYYQGREPIAAPGRIVARGFTATISGARASGVLTDPQVCGNRMFKWTARSTS
jgi:hypothetical protein